MADADDLSEKSSSDTAAYQDLLKKYQELQLRVTRFSAVEQQMINIRHRLDHEIVMHKRMHAVNKMALTDISDESFVKLMAESVVDIFEVEMALVVIIHTEQPDDILFGTEGVAIDQHRIRELYSTLSDLCKKNTTGNILLLEPGDDNRIKPFFPLRNAYCIRLKDQSNNVKILIVGGILESGLLIYEPPDKDRDVIFGIFAQQVLAQVVNRKKNKTIIRQVEAIETSGRRLARITDSFLSFGASPADNIDLLTRLCGELMNADIAIYSRLDQTSVQCIGTCEAGKENEHLKKCELCRRLFLGMKDDTFTIVGKEQITELKKRFICHNDKMQAFAGCTVFRENKPIGSLSVMYHRDYQPDDNEKQVMKIISAGIAVEELRNVSLEKLRQHEQLLASVVQTQKEMICRYQPDTTLTFVNRPFCILMGRSEEQMLGRRLTDFVSADTIRDILESMPEISIESPSRNYIHRAVDKNGVEHWSEWTDTGVFDHQNNLLEIQSIGRDITESKMAEQERIARKVAEDSSRTKSIFVANMSHEIRTPLNAILGYADILDAALVTPEHKNYLSSIKTSSKSLLTIINDVLDLSKIEAGKIELQYDIVDSQTFFSQFRQIFSPKLDFNQTEYILDIDPSAPAAIYIDEIRLLQIITNLIANAVKFTHGGQIRLSVKTMNRYESREPGHSGTFAELIIAVEDTGIGIPAHLQELVFDEFVQVDNRKTQGTGLGLSITRRLVQLMGGEISLKSEINKGSVFTIRIPDVACFDDLTDTFTTIRPDPGLIEFDPSVVIVVDDNKTNRRYLRDAMKKTAVRVISVPSGAIALRIAGKIKPDLIITDIRLPGMDGFELLERVRQNEAIRHIPVVAYTASALQDSKIRILKKDFAGLLVKPVRLKDLVAELCKHLPHKIKSTEPSVHAETIPVAEKILDLPELVKILELDFLTKCDALKKRQPMSEIREFGQGLSLLGQKHRVELLSQCGEDMINATDHFDIERILWLINRFPDIVETLKKILK